jgi:hypothetical protein
MRCKKVGIPSTYANDNHDRWRSDFSAVLSHCMKRDAYKKGPNEKDQFEETGSGSGAAMTKFA